MTDQLTVEQAAEKRDAGLARSAEHAERIDPGWQDQAMDKLRQYLSSQEHWPSSSFLAEHVLDVVLAFGLPEPPDRRAWGAVMARACREGLIEKVGYAPARTSNLSPKVLWRAVK